MQRPSTTSSCPLTKLDASLARNDPEGIISLLRLIGQIPERNGILHAKPGMKTEAVRCQLTPP
jgi:hypothetical protein